ncbi:TPA: zinc-ribbon domain-containing protein, partial [Enterobacter roggenkampii]|nr:zinc-ribbon domain-containing protein [Escherichia coli]MBW4236902.1 zinc-ribbon domain-containing protein [Enterobacter roggenkampii]HCR0805020.1 zinc-ribbon domain-containing protein [Enterobacter roggenkampii]
RFCQQCGTSLVPSACAQCGTTLQPGTKFCAQCGKAAV